MTPETLAQINDLRARVRAADEAQRAGDGERYRALMPSDDEIISALECARNQRAASAERKASASTAKAEAAAMQVIDLNALFS